MQQSIQLDISNDIFDRVISFLEILPKKKLNSKRLTRVLAHPLTILAQK